MGFDNLIFGYACFPIEAINVLREKFKKETLVGKQTNEQVGEGRLIFARVQLMCESVEWQRIVSKIRYVKNALRRRQFCG